MPMDKPNFALFPRFLSLAAPKLVRSPPHKGQPGTLYISPRPTNIGGRTKAQVSHIPAGSAMRGPFSHLPFKLWCWQIFMLKEVWIQKPIVSSPPILETGSSLKLIIGTP